jgi:GTPase SAR1 family protein
MNQAEACEFCQLIQYKFPDAQFTLIVIGSDSDQFGADWNIPHIKNFLLKSELRSLWVEGSHLQEELYKKIMSGELKE